MEPGFENAASYPPLKPLKPMECLQRRSGIGGELGAFPCTMLMAVGSCCSHRPATTLITIMNVRFNRPPNHPEEEHEGHLFLWLEHQGWEEMNQEGGMRKGIQEVRSPGIMDADAFENRQDPNRVQSVLSAALIHMILGEGRSTGDMLPVSLPSHRQARFVLMKNGGLDQRLFDLVLDGSQLGGRALDQFPHRCFTPLTPHQVTQPS